MINSISTSVMGMNAMNTKMAGTANNLANSNTDEYKKDQVTLSENENGGVSAEVSKVNTPGPIVEDRGETRELSNVDLAEEMTDQIPTQATYSANIKMIQTQDQMIGTVLNIKK